MIEAAEPESKVKELLESIVLEEDDLSNTAKSKVRKEDECKEEVKVDKNIAEVELLEANTTQVNPHKIIMHE